MQNPMLRILLVEDVDVVREELVALFDAQPDRHAVAHTDSGEATVLVAVRSQAEVAVIDADLPGSVLSAALRLHQDHPCPTLILTGVESWPGPAGDAAGVVGLLLRRAQTSDLAAAVRAVAVGSRLRTRNGTVAGAADPGEDNTDRAPAAAAGGTINAAVPDTTEQPGSPLSPRETDVLRLTARGASVREVAGMLSLSPGTVRNHLSSVGTKLRARTRVDAVRIAHQAGWLD